MSRRPKDIKSFAEASDISPAQKHRQVVRSLANTLPNRKIKWLINSGVFDTGDYALDGLIRQRLFEYKHIMNSPDLARPYHRDLVQQLSKCSVARPCRMLISPITRLLYTIADARRLWDCLSEFEGSVYFETPLISVHHIDHDDVIKDIVSSITLDRKSQRNHLAHMAKSRRWYRSIIGYGFYELVIYRHEELQEAYALHMDRGVKRARKDEDKNGLPKPRVIEALLSLGWDPTRGGDVAELHRHGLLYLRRRDKFEPRQQQLYSTEYGYDLKNLRKNRTFRENIDGAAAYMLKASPRYERAIKGRSNNMFLRGAALRLFMDFQALGYQGLKYQVGLPGIDKIALKNAKKMLIRKAWSKQRASGWASP